MNKKIVALVLCVAIIASALTAGTIAWFTDKDEVANTFTVGNVKIDLFETYENSDGEKNQEGFNFKEAIVPGREFHKDPTIELLEGSQDSYVFLDLQINKYKSLFPVIAANAGVDVHKEYLGNGLFSTKTYLNAMLEQENKAEFQRIVNAWFGGITHEDWQICGYFYDTAEDDLTTKGNYMTIRFAYIGEKTLSATDKVTFMETFQMPSSVTQDMLENNNVTYDFAGTEKEPFKMNFKAYAIQAAELETVEDAFTALFGTELKDNEYWNGVTMGLGL